MCGQSQRLVIIQAAAPVIGPYISPAMATIHHQQSETISRLAATT